MQLGRILWWCDVFTSDAATSVTNWISWGFPGGQNLRMRPRSYLVVDPAGNPVHFDSFLSLVVFTILESLRVSWQFCHPHCILIRLRKVFLQGSISKHDECFCFCCCISTKPEFVAETKNSLGVLIHIIIENSKLHWCGTGEQINSEGNSPNGRLETICWHHGLTEMKS